MLLSISPVPIRPRDARWELGYQILSLKKGGYGIGEAGFWLTLTLGLSRGDMMVNL